MEDGVDEMELMQAQDCLNDLAYEYEMVEKWG
jgi:hypothetical protein